MTNDDVEGLGYSPTVRKRRLSALLVDLRHQAGMGVVEVCHELEMARWTLHRIENALWVRPKPRDVRDLCELYGAPAEQTKALMQLAREGRERGWWRRYDDVLRGDFVGFEAGASAIRAYEPTLVHGLLQTPDYVRGIARAAGAVGEQEIERRVETRRERQRILDRDEPPTLDVVLDETALLRRVGTDAQRAEQIEHVREMTRRDNVTVRLLRLDDGPHPAIGTSAFTMLDFPHERERSLVYTETEVDSRYMEEPDELDAYNQVWQRVCEAALGPEDTLAHLPKLSPIME